MMPKDDQLTALTREVARLRTALADAIALNESLKAQVRYWADNVRFRNVPLLPDEIPALYDVARQVNHDAGFPWTDPRTGVTYQPPKVKP